MMLSAQHEEVRLLLSNIECCTLCRVQAFVVLGILVYMHVVFARTPVSCLSHVADSWPRHGILRVEIVRNASENYSIINSYEKVGTAVHFIGYSYILGCGGALNCIMLGFFFF
jgi:predicted transcriptional regulator